MTKTADALLAKAPAFVEAMMAETGATQGWEMFNVSLALLEPVGVLLGSAPRNGPVVLDVRALAVPLACGNTVMLKASETCPQTHQLIVEAFEEAGFPGGVVNMVTNALADAADQLYGLNGRGPSGGPWSGGALETCVARRPLLLVLEDADLDEAVKAAAFGAFMNPGQNCLSTERIIVLDTVADAFVEKFRAKAASMRVGDPRGGKSPLGAVVDLWSVARVDPLEGDALSKGTVRLTGGEAEGVLKPTTVIDGVPPAMPLFREESFGPVVAVLRAADEDEAIRLANDMEYGLAASVFTRDAARGLRGARRTKSGICPVNGPTAPDEPAMPFGGVSGSGYGRFGGKAGIDAFTELRWITIDTQPGQYSI